MQTQSTSTQTQPPDAAARAEARAAWLHEIAAMGMDQLRKVMTAPQEVDDDARIDQEREKARSLSYDILTKGLRRTMALAARLDAIAAKAHTDRKAQVAEHSAKAAVRRREVAAVVTPIIESVRRQPCELDTVWREFSDWLDTRSADPAFTTAEVVDTAAAACEALGLAIRWTQTRKPYAAPEWSLQPLPRGETAHPARIAIRGPP